MDTLQNTLSPVFILDSVIMSSTLRRRRNRSISIAESAESFDDDPSFSPSASTCIPRRPTIRPRSKSMHATTTTTTSSINSFLPYRSSLLLTSLDLPASIYSLREYLLGRVDQAEQGIELLKAYVEDESSSSEDWGLMADTEEEEEDDDDEEEADAEEEVDDGKKRSARIAGVQLEERQVVSLNAKRRKARTVVDPTLATERQPTSEQVKKEITALEQFINKTSRFLAAIRAELPSISKDESSSSSSSSASSSLVQFQLSPEARLALDHFLEDHPIPALPTFNLRERIDSSRQKASDSATALLSRVTNELVALQEALNYLTTTETVSSYLPSLPTIPTLPSTPMVLTDLRDYFSSESTRLGHHLQRLRPRSATFSKVSDNFRVLRNEASSNYHAGVAHLQDGANELTALLSSSGTMALDEAARIYHAALTRGKERLLSYEELPFPWRNNEHIITGYRFYPIERWGVLLRSAFEIHNETINIQSHFVGFLSLVYLLVYVLPGSPHWLPDSHWADTAIALLFVGAAMKCLLCSAAWHLLAGCATDHWHRGAACVDYVGISGLIAASVMGIEYYGFYCRPNLATFYMSFSTVLGVTGMILPWQPWFNERRFKSYRIAFFLSLGGSAAMPLLHMALLYGLGKTFWFFIPAGLSVAAYLVGLSFYGYQFPECTSPGRWDIFFASHQVWHVAIVLAVWAHWWAMSGWARLASQGNDLSCAAMNHAF